MKSKIAALTCLMMALPGCSLNNGPGDGDNQRPPEEMAQVLRTRVKYVTAFAFGMDAVKPHKVAVCQFAEQLGTFLDTYDDKDASFVKLQAAVNELIGQISEPAVRDAVAIMADMVLTETFNYAWQHYEGLINQDQTKMALIIAGAIADGLRDACGMNVSSMGATSHPQGIFTVRS